MVPAHRTVLRRTAALVLLAAFMFAVVIGCNSESRSTSYRTLRTIAGFTGTGNGRTAHFVTNGDWVLAWACEPPTFQVPFDLRISVMQGGNLVMAPVMTTCETPSSAGNFEVHQSGEQWLDVGTNDNAGGWALSVNVPQSDTGAELVSTLLCRLPCRCDGVTGTVYYEASSITTERPLPAYPEQSIRRGG